MPLFRAEVQSNLRVQQKAVHLRTTAARALLHKLDERSDTVEHGMPVEAPIERAPIGSILQVGSQATHRLVNHCFVLLIVLCIISGGGFRSWSAAQIAAARAEQDIRPPVLPYSWQADIVHPIAPINMAADQALYDQLAPRQLFSRTSESPLFVRSYTVQSGDTFQSIATANNISPETLLWVNGFENGAILPVGVELRIPRISGVTHVVEPEETIEVIAQHYSVPVEAIELLPENALKPGAQPVAGTELFVPGGHVEATAQIVKRYGSIAQFAAQPAQLAGVVREPQTNVRLGPGRAYPRAYQFDQGERIVPLAKNGEWVKVDIDGDAGWVLIDLVDLPAGLFDTLPVSNDIPPPPVVWVWPTRGVLTSPFGQRWGALHNGLDIANQAWTPIVAARAGRVHEAGWCSGYGYCVKIQHGDGIETIYGHLVTKPKVRAGDEVAAGQFIGSMGSTYDASGGGYSTGVHLHFTIKVNGRAVNPLNYLP